MKTKSTKLKPINNKPVNILFCGLVRTPNLFKNSLQDFIKLRSQGLVNQIILSTWKGEVKDQKLLNYFKKNNIKLIETIEPKNRGTGNIWCQMKALEIGLNNIKSNSFVLKTRTDAYINPKFLIKIFTSQDLFKIKKTLPKGNIFRNKIWIIWYELSRPFFMADECFYGLKEDLKLMVNYNSAYDTKYTLGPGTAHVRRFIDPFIKKYPEVEKSLSKHNKDAIFRKFVQDFTEKVIDLRNLKFLRKIYEIRRFTSLRKKLENQDFTESLAAYYSILYSHFYIDGDSFPNQVIFRDSSLPSVKLNPFNLEKNFTKEKSRFPYGGQIYDYNQNLITNICEKKLEITPFANKIYKAIDKFNYKNA